MKFIITIILLNLSLFAFNSEDYLSMSADPLKNNNLENIKKEFEYLHGIKNNNSGINKELISEFNKKIKGLTYKEAINYVNMFYKDSVFMTKNEALALVKLNYQMRYDVLHNSHMFLLYFFTEEVPMNSTANILLGVSALQENGIKIESKQYLTGPPENVEEFMNKWKTFAYDYPFKYQNNIVRNYHLKFDPRFFKVYAVDKAPAMALAFCKSAIPTPKTCRIKYLIRGDTSLFNFFDKISKVEHKYIKFSNILKANGIYLPNKKIEVIENEK